MRLWSLHPKYLDAKGIVALWREALLAQKVLAGQTRGYKEHPQLLRFKRCKNPQGAIASYLRAIRREAARRGYCFDGKKIGRGRARGKITVTSGQIRYEFAWLRDKLRRRDKMAFEHLRSIRTVETHPLFRARRGGIENWERRRNASNDESFKGRV